MGKSRCYHTPLTSLEGEPLPSALTRDALSGSGTPHLLNNMSGKGKTVMKRHVAAPVGVLATLALMLICPLPACPGVAVPTYQTKDSSLNLAQYVNPFIGTSPSSDAHSGFYFDSGDVTPAATYPMGMVQWGPDTTTKYYSRTYVI
jgi:hypothetical protein